MARQWPTDLGGCGRLCLGLTAEQQRKGVAEARTFKSTFKV
jgi:hypothetical protein